MLYPSLVFVPFLKGWLFFFVSFLLPFCCFVLFTSGHMRNTQPSFVFVLDLSCHDFCCLPSCLCPFFLLSLFLLLSFFPSLVRSCYFMPSSTTVLLFPAVSSSVAVYVVFYQAYPHSRLTYTCICIYIYAFILVLLLCLGATSILLQPCRTCCVIEPVVLSSSSSSSFSVLFSLFFCLPLPHTCQYT